MHSHRWHRSGYAPGSNIQLQWYQPGGGGREHKMRDSDYLFHLQIAGNRNISKVLYSKSIFSYGVIACLYTKSCLL